MQIKDLDYLDTFSPIELTIFWLVLARVATHH